MTSKKKIILIGGGGHCVSCIDVIELENKYDILGILDPKLPAGDYILGYPVLGDDSQIGSLAKKDIYFLVTVGQIETPYLKNKLFQDLLSLNANIATVVSPRAYVGKECKVGEGTIIMHDVLINRNASVGRNCIVNSKAIIEHESIVGDNTHISTGAIINGATKIGNQCFIGSNATIAHHLIITDNVTIGANSLVIKPITEPGVYIANKLTRIR